MYSFYHTTMEQYSKHQYHVYRGVDKQDPKDQGPHLSSGAPRLSSSGAHCSLKY